MRQFLWSKNGVDAPNLFAISLISLLSVDTTVSVIYFDFKEALIE